MSHVGKVIIFVCTSNTCRSPIAEGFGNHWIEKNELLGQYDVISRGLTDMYEPPGSQASAPGIEVMLEDYGIDISNHRSRLLSSEDVHEASIIIGVSRSHKNHIISNYPQFEHKVTCLNDDVPDPWHSPKHVYRQCMHMMAPLVYSKLNELIKT